MSIRSYTLLGRIAWWAKRTSAGGGGGGNRLWLACEQPSGTPGELACRLRYYRNVMVNFKPGEYTKKLLFFSSSHKLSLPSFSPPPPLFTRSRAHIFACLSLRRHPYYLRAWKRLISQWHRRIRTKKIKPPESLTEKNISKIYRSFELFAHLRTVPPWLLQCLYVDDTGLEQ